MNIKLLNLDTAEALKNLFPNAYEKNKLVQAIINTKVKRLQKLPLKILKQVKLAMRDLEVNNNRLYVRDKIYIPNNKKLQLHLL